MSSFVVCWSVGRSVGSLVEGCRLIPSLIRCQMFLSLIRWRIALPRGSVDPYPSVIDLVTIFPSLICSCITWPPGSADQVMSPILSVMHLVTSFSVIDLMTGYLATWICRPTFVTNSFRHWFDDEFSRHFEGSSVFSCSQKCKQWVPLTASQRRHRKGGDCGDFCQRMLPWTSLPSHVRRACCHCQKEIP